MYFYLKIAKNRILGCMFIRKSIKILFRDMLCQKIDKDHVLGCIFQQKINKNHILGYIF